jgi:alpha-L-fucosidase
LYVHLFDYPTDGKLLLPGYKGKIKYAQFLHDNSELKMMEQGNDILLTLPEKKPVYEIPVVELTVN